MDALDTRTSEADRVSSDGQGLQAWSRRAELKGYATRNDMIANEGSRERARAAQDDVGASDAPVHRKTRAVAAQKCEPAPIFDPVRRRKTTPRHRLFVVAAE